MFAAVDLGSNSFRLHIGEHDGTTMRIVETARDPIRLAAGLDAQGSLTEAAMQSALQCLSTFRAILARYELSAVRVVATNTLRVARNAQAFLPRAEAAIGYPIEIISGEEEGRLIYMGVVSQLTQPDEKRLVVDIGGGSTEIILGCGDDIRVVESFSIGTHRQSTSFFSDGRISAASFDAAIMSARSCFEDAALLYDPQHWSHAYGSSGTMRAIANVIAKNGIGDGTMSYNSLLALKMRLIECRRVDAFDLPGIKQERVIVMVGGLAVLIGIMQELGIKSLTTVNAGLRLGVLRDLQLRATKHDRRDQAVNDFLHRFRGDENRAGHVARISAKLYALLKPNTDAFGKYLQWSSLLHEVGLSISHTGAHKHSAYIVENADMPGFTTREQRVMSTLIVGQKGNLRKIAEALSDPDFARAVLALRLAAMFMHSKIDADVDDLQLRMKNRIEIEIKRDWLAQHPTVSYWLEKERDAWEEVGVPMSVKVG